VKSFSADEPDGDFTVWGVDGGRAVSAWFGGRLDAFELLENGERWVCAAPGREPASDETRCREDASAGRP